RGAAQPERVLLLLRLRVRHQDQRAIAAGIADERETDTRVAGRAFDDEPAALDDAALLGVEHHVFGGSVLDRAAGVQELGLAENRAARELRGLAQLDERRIPDRVEKVLAYIHERKDACVLIPRR